MADIPRELRGLRIAVVHPWLVEVRGGEKVFFEIARALPEADLFILLARKDRLPPDLRPRLRGTSFLQLAPKRLFRATLPLLPVAAGRMRLEQYDLVVSSSSGWSHGVRVGEQTVHVSYVHSPPRYLWWERSPTLAGRLAGPLLGPLRGWLRRWDARAAAGPDLMLANSQLTAERIRRYYHREAHVLSPPVEVERFLGTPWAPQGYAISVGELVGYKRVDRAIEACHRAGVPLRIVGDGPQRAALEGLAADRDVRFLGRIPDRELERELAGASVYVHAGIEDFGITTVEAMAAGVPVAGINAGGTAEIAGHGPVELAEPDVESLAAAIRRCLDAPDAHSDREAARAFSGEAFRAGLFDALVRALSERVERAPDASQR